MSVGKHFSFHFQYWLRSELYQGEREPIVSRLCPGSKCRLLKGGRSQPIGGACRRSSVRTVLWLRGQAGCPPILRSITSIMTIVFLVLVTSEGYLHQQSMCEEVFFLARDNSAAVC